MTLSKSGAPSSPGELAAGGFEVGEVQGFPIVKCPATVEDCARVITFPLSLAVERRIYKEGMLFIPAGSWEVAHQRLKDREAR